MYRAAIFVYGNQTGVVEIHYCDETLNGVSRTWYEVWYGLPGHQVRYPTDGSKSHAEAAHDMLVDALW